MEVAVAYLCIFAFIQFVMRESHAVPDNRGTVEHQHDARMQRDDLLRSDLVLSRLVR